MILGRISIETKGRSKRGTIKTRLIVVPLIIVFLVIVSIGVFSSYFLKQSLLSEMETNGGYLVKNLILNVQDNFKALTAVQEQLDNHIKTSAKVAMGIEKELINDQQLEKLASELGVEEISWYDETGTIVFSSVAGNAGWRAEGDHPIVGFMKSSDKEWLEPSIRVDSISGNYFKFGYLKRNDGYFVQIGVLANRINELTEEFDHQKILDDLVLDEEVVYALFMDNEGKVTGHSDRDQIGQILTDEGSIKAGKEGVSHVQNWYYEEAGVEVMDISYPTILDGHHFGGMSVGMSLENVNKTIRRNVLTIIAITIVAFGVLGLILYNASKYVVTVTQRLREQVKLMEEGDFSVDMAEDLINKNDELGEISSAINTMQLSIRDIITNVIGAAQNLAASSEELTATSEQSATAADEVARAIEEIAGGATEQAKDTEDGVQSITQLGDIVIQNEIYLNHLNEAAEKVNTLKDEGLEILKELIEITEESGKSSMEVKEVVLNANESAVKITAASEMIRSIADQTNLLALNAAIEAARAGEAGRGFAVVADEIRKLAEETNKFTEEISNVVEELTEKTHTAVETMGQVEKTVISQGQSVEETSIKFSGIAESIELMKESIVVVNDSGKEITSKKEEVIKVMEHLSAISEENAAGTQEASASVEEQTASTLEIARSSEQLAHLAEELNDRVKQFRV